MNSAAAFSKSGIAHDSRFDGVVALRHQVIAQHLVDESLFGRALDTA
jgi:hypothetical protein